MADELPEAIQLPWDPANWDCWTPFELSSHLEGLPRRWCVVGGWALDLHIGVQHRRHSDLEIIVPRPDFPALRDKLSDHDFFVAGAEGQWPLEAAGAAFDRYQQTFVRDRETGLFRLDVMRVEDIGVWRFAHNHDITRSWSESIDHVGRVPFLRPEQVLLYKAVGINANADPRLKDAEDFLVTLPFLDQGSRRWLAANLAACRPEHPWLRTLSLLIDAVDD